MEPKKNPNKDVHRYSRSIFLASLGISLLIVITAFEWRSKVDIKDGCRLPFKPEDVVYLPIPITNITPDIPKPIKPPKIFNITKIKPAENSPGSEETIKPFEIEQPLSSPFEIAVLTPILPKESIDTIFRLVEKMPEPVGGYEKFRDHLRKNMRYPLVAKRSNKEGMVVVQFTVSETGTLSNFKILKSVGAGCDEEAIRVIALSKWNAGKQRGIPVKVLMQQPIYFVLN